jgi:hypothetical protein
MSPREIFIQMLLTRSKRSIFESAIWSTIFFESSRIELKPWAISW